MPKAKATDKKIDKIEIVQPKMEVDKIIEIDEEEKTLEDEETVAAEGELADGEEDELGLDEEEVDPFNDKWEQ